MRADDFLQFLSQALYVLIFMVVGTKALRRPSRTNVDISLLFGAAAGLTAIEWVTNAAAVKPGHMLAAITASLAMALPYLLLRLVDDFAEVRLGIVRAAEAGLVLAVVSVFIAPNPLPEWLTLLLVLYFAVLAIYCSVQFVRQARQSIGVTRRRMQAVAGGSAFLGLAVVVAGLKSGLPGLNQVWTVLEPVLPLASGLCYFLGFTPPPWLRRAWQEPELRAFLRRAANLPRLTDTESIVRELERGARNAVGAPTAAIGLWDESAEVLLFSVNGETISHAPGTMLGSRSFVNQQPLFTPNSVHDDPTNAEFYRAYDSIAILAAPITAGRTRLGVLIVYAPRAPIFAEHDLALVQLLADQAAVILESRALIDEATGVRAREEAARLKNDFLSAAAHDLKTPLTTLIAQAQLLQRRAVQWPEAPVDVAGVERIEREANRLRALVLELLDAARVEQDKLVTSVDRVDLVELAREVCGRQSSERHRCTVEAAEPVVGEYDRNRLLQLLENLVENAIKYSPAGGDVLITVVIRTDEALLTVSDTGIGIPPPDLPRVFDRFHRGANVDDRRFAGMGLGLFICRGIVEQHRGRIWVTSSPGRGSTFHVTLPVMTAVVAE